MTVRYRPDKGWWLGRFWLHGVLYEQGAHPTKRKALDWVVDRRRELTGHGGSRPLTPVRVAAAIGEYLAAVVAGHRNAGGEGYTLCRFRAEYGARPVASLTTADVEAYRARRATAPSGQWTKGRRQYTGTPRVPSPATVNRDLAHLSAWFTWCEERGYTQGPNPARARRRHRRGGVSRARELWRPWIILTPAQRTRLWTLIPIARERIKAELLLHLGVRLRVVLELTWERVDWTHGVIQYASKGKDRVIPMNATARRLLRQLGPKPTGRVFPEQTHSTLRKYWRRARLALGLPTLRLHDLRVTFARELASRGVDLRIIQELLGHSTLAMVARYIPADLQGMRRAVATLDAENRRTGRRTWARPEAEKS